MVGEVKEKVCLARIEGMDVWCGERDPESSHWSPMNFSKNVG